MPVAGKPSATVHMTDEGYSPRVLEIEQGQTVEFVNDSSRDYWPASDPHPIHTGYPGFDAGKTILPGESWDFTFNRAGRFGYHNHLAPETHAVDRYCEEGLVAEPAPLRHSDSRPAGENLTHAARCATLPE